MVARRENKRPFLAVEGVTKEYPLPTGTREALTHISLELKEGEMVALLGPSGCGKTTLLKIIAGLLTPTRGSVQLRNTLVERPRAEIGFVFQAPTLLPWRSVESNVLLPAQVKRNRVSLDLRPKSSQLLKELGLGGFEQAYPKDLSGGMQQRVALARALLLEPPLLLLDEPFGALDEPTRRDLGSLLSSIVTRRRLTCLVVSHDVAEAVFVAHRVLVLSARPGRIVQEIKVPLSAPRTLSVLSDKRFLELVARASQTLFARQ